jgi:hypothetical protein
MLRLLDAIPWVVLVPLAILLALAPFGQTPHLVEKARMLAAGTLRRPIDIFDLFLHATPLAVVAVKLAFLLISRTPTKG